MAKVLRRLKLKSADVENVCSVSRQTVHAWKTGAANPSLANVALLIAELKRRGIKADLSDFIAPTRRAA